jgi:hypothetical protein
MAGMDQTCPFRPRGAEKLRARRLGGSAGAAEVCGAGQWRKLRAARNSGNKFLGTPATTCDSLLTMYSCVICRRDAATADGAEDADRKGWKRFMAAMNSASAGLAPAERRLPATGRKGILSLSAGLAPAGGRLAAAWREVVAPPARGRRRRDVFWATRSSRQSCLRRGEPGGGPAGVNGYEQGETNHENARQ